jgi:transposase InsO family protein
MAEGGAAQSNGLDFATKVETKEIVEAEIDLPKRSNRKKRTARAQRKRRGMSRRVEANFEREITIADQRDVCRMMQTRQATKRTFTTPNMDTATQRTRSKRHNRRDAGGPRQNYYVLGVDEAEQWLGSSDIGSEQLNDSILCEIMTLKADGGSNDVSHFKATGRDAKTYAREWESLYLAEGVLQRLDAKTGCKQVVIPTALRLKFTEACHAESGHMGRAKTAERLNRRAYFPGWKRSVKTVCDECGLCAERCRGAPPRQGPMQVMEVAAPMERIQLDLVGPNPTTPRRNQWILTMIDSFSRYLISVPLRTKEARHVAAALNRYLFAVWGLCREIYHDQGREFDNRLIKSICQEYGIRDLRTSPFRAQANGRCERVHRTMHDIFSKVVADDQKDWDLVLAGVTAAYNASKHESTGYSPNLLMTGREALTPLDLPLGKGRGTEKKDLTSVDGYQDKLQSKMREVYAAARRRSALKAVERKRRYDAKVKGIEFLEGDQVLIRREVPCPGLNAKWRRLYRGPYVIVSKLGPVNYVVTRNADGRDFKLFC